MVPLPKGGVISPEVSPTVQGEHMTVIFTSLGYMEKGTGFSNNVSFHSKRLYVYNLTCYLPTMRLRGSEVCPRDYAIEQPARLRSHLPQLGFAVRRLRMIGRNLNLETIDFILLLPDVMLYDLGIRGVIQYHMSLPPI